MEENKVLEQLAKLRKPFDKKQISKLPKPTKVQTDAVKKNFKEGIRCQICGGWHHPKVIHLDYVGHAALTDRLLSVDINWTWEPLAFDPITNLPLFDKEGGLWIKLTICGMTRLGYGDSGTKKGPDAIKETIGDALRNAAMRFGAALDLWHKGELHQQEEDDKQESIKDEHNEPKKEDPAFRKWLNYIDAFVDKDLSMFETALKASINPELKKLTGDQAMEMTIAINEMKIHLTEKEQ